MNISVALFEPRIPQNTGNIARTCAAYKCNLNLIEPLGFSLEDKYLKRAGLDYWPYVPLYTHKNFDEFRKCNSNNRLICFSKQGNNFLSDFKFINNDVLIFGREDTGLPDSIKELSDHICTIPMPGISDSSGNGGVRSLNLSVSVGIALYKALEKY